MKTSKQLKEEGAELEDKLEALVRVAQKAALTAEQKAEFDSLTSQIADLDKDIARTEKIEAIQKAKASKKLDEQAAAVGAPQDSASEVKEMNKISGKYSFARATQSIFRSKNIDGYDGVERELFQEAQNEAKIAGIALEGNIALPSKFVQFPKHKSLLDVNTEGTDAVYTEFAGLIPILRPNPVLSQLGVRPMTGLQGNVQFTRQNGDVSYAFETETSDVNETTPTLDNISLSPKRFGGYLDVSNQFLIQAPWVVEPWIREQLEVRYALTVDTQGLVADGSSNQCTGIINYSGVNVITLGSGSANDMTWGAILEFIRSTKVANARNGRSGFLTNANGEFALARTPMQGSGVEGNFIYKMDGRLVGRNFLTSELIPSNFSEGGQSDLVGMIYSSRWESLLIGIWGGLDLLFDPYTQALGGKKRFVVNAFMDVDVEQPLEFSVCKDWDATDLPAIT